MNQDKKLLEKYEIVIESIENHKTKYGGYPYEIPKIKDLPQNDEDVVLLKDDGLPTYHFAHACDDHFMRTNLVTRGEEWIPSLPIHVEALRLPIGAGSHHCA